MVASFVFKNVVMYLKYEKNRQETIFIKGDSNPNNKYVLGKLWTFKEFNMVNN